MGSEGHVAEMEKLYYLSKNLVKNEVCVGVKYEVIH